MKTRNFKKWICLGAMLSMLNTQAQIYTSKTSLVHFFSATVLENIEAKTNAATAAINATDGGVAIKISVKTFKFDSKLMEEHFNENYLETEKFPMAEFKGKIVDLKAVNFSKDGEYNAIVEGNLTMHGVTKSRKIEVKFVVKGTIVTATAKFVVPLVDHNIERPKIVWEKIAENIDIDVKLEFIPYVKK